MMPWEKTVVHTCNDVCMRVFVPTQTSIVYSWVVVDIFEKHYTQTRQTLMNTETIQ